MSDKKNTLELPDGTTMKYEPIVEFKCIYCGLIAAMVQFETGDMGVTHLTPECPNFIVMDPLTFVAENRKKFEKDIADGLFKPN